MIQSDAPILAGTQNPFALGGLVGSLLFAGYMLTQFPGGFVGDRLGHRTVIVIAIVWAGIATLLSGVMTALVGFVALRVITGLAIGITLAMLPAAPLIDLGSSVFGAGDAWRMPFLVLGTGAILIGLGMHRFFRSQGGEHAFKPVYLPAAARLLGLRRGLLLRRDGDLRDRHRGGPSPSGRWRCSSSVWRSRSSPSSSRA